MTRRAVPGDAHAARAAQAPQSERLNWTWMRGLPSAMRTSAFGMRVVWCNRNGQRPERLPGAPDREVRTLAELPALIAP